MVRNYCPQRHSRMNQRLLHDSILNPFLNRNVANRIEFFDQYSPILYDLDWDRCGVCDCGFIFGFLGLMRWLMLYVPLCQMSLDWRRPSRGRRCGIRKSAKPRCCASVWRTRHRRAGVSCSKPPIWWSSAGRNWPKPPLNNGDPSRWLRSRHPATISLLGRWLRNANSPAYQITDDEILQVRSR